MAINQIIVLVSGTPWYFWRKSTANSSVSFSCSQFLVGKYLPEQNVERNLKNFWSEKPLDFQYLHDRQRWLTPCGLWLWRSPKFSGFGEVDTRLGDRLAVHWLSYQRLISFSEFLMALINLSQNILHFTSALVQTSHLRRVTKFNWEGKKEFKKKKTPLLKALKKNRYVATLSESRLRNGFHRSSTFGMIIL